MDNSVVGKTAMNLMEYLEDKYGDEPEIEIGEVCIIVEVRGREDDGVEYTAIHTGCSDDRKWIQEGMLHAALYS